MTGFLSARDLKLHMEELYKVQRIIQRMQSEINYHNKDLGHILETIGRSETGVYHIWLTSISHRMKDKKCQRFETMWVSSIEDVLKGNVCHLGKKDLNQLKLLGSAFGQVDIDFQNQMIAQYLEEIKQEIARGRAELAGQIKLRCTLGLTAGLFLMVLLI